MNHYPLAAAGAAGATAGVIVLAWTLLPTVGAWAVTVPVVGVVLWAAARAGQLRVSTPSEANYPGAALGVLLPLLLGVPVLAIRGTDTAWLWGPVLAVVAVVAVTVAFRRWMPWMDHERA